MRVLAVGSVYPPHLLGGYEIVWHGVMEHLRRHGDAVCVLATTYRSPLPVAPEPDEPDVHRELRWYWCDHEWPKIWPPGRLAIERHNAAVFDRHVAEFRPDVLTWWPMGGMSLGLIERGRRHGLPAVLFVHDYWPRYGLEHDLWIRMWANRSWIARTVDRLTGLPTSLDLAAAGRWLFNSRAVLEDTLETGLAPPDAGVLSPGISQPFLDAEERGPEEPWRGRLLYLGRVVENKGVHTAIKALSQLPDATLRVVGEGDVSYRIRLEALAKRLRCDERVRFAPPVGGEALFDEYRGADAVVFPVEWSEPWGLVPLEAMALGTPVIATGRGGSGDFLVHRENALLFASGDADALSSSVRALAEDPALRERLRGGGFRTAHHHTAERFNQRAREEIEAAVAGRRGATLAAR